ncbi:MAG TPA: nicotinate-nicotinamide nucleotide adenylyltransferase [Candidatus Paceibacterota bacterium]
MKGSRKKRITVVGSAANPPTRAHRELAETLTKSGEFDRVLWLPSGSRPDKPNLIPAEHRTRMTELMFHESWRREQPTEFAIDLREAGRASIPTIYILRELKQEYPDAEIVFATGVDVLVPREEYGGKCDVLYYWDEGESLMNNWTFVVLPRVDYPHPRVLQQEGKIPKHFLIIDRPPSLVGWASSTEVRRRVACGESFDELVDPRVAEYIHTHKLYQSP